MSVGSGLLTTLYPRIPDGNWKGYQILCGIGYFLVLNMLRTIGSRLWRRYPINFPPLGTSGCAMLAGPPALSHSEPPQLYGMSSSCAVFFAAGQSVFQERFAYDLSRVAPADAVNEVLSVGTIRFGSI